MKRLSRVCSLGLLFVGAIGCSSVVSVGYDREHSLRPEVTAAARQPASVAVGAFVDQRSHDVGTKWVGSIRGGYGNALKELDLEQSVPETVAAAFTDGLKARGLLASPTGGAFVLAGRVKEIVSNQMVGQEATVQIEVTVTDRSSGTTVLSKPYSADKKTSPGIFSNGVFGSVDDLRQILANTLTDTVDQALDDPAFRAAIGDSAAAPAVNTSTTSH
jgi:hypothetical protein